MSWAAEEFEIDEWKSVFILNNRLVPKKVPELNTVIRLIAQRGGFLARKGDGEPGVKAIGWACRMWLSLSKGCGMRDKPAGSDLCITGWL